MVDSVSYLFGIIIGRFQITTIFNLSLKSRIFADEWKKAWLLPIYKPNDKCEHFRPISILYQLLVKLLVKSINFLTTIRCCQNIKQDFVLRIRLCLR